MMYSSILVTVSIIWAIAAITPGPNFFIAVHTAVGETRRLSFFTVLGIVTGTFVWAMSGYFGVTILFNTMPILYYSLKLLGGMYLMCIGIALLLRKRGDQIPRQSKKPLSVVYCFRLGLFTNILNPKTAAFMTSLFAATMPPNASFNLGILCILLICSISALWYSLVATVFSCNWAKRAYVNCQRYIERVAGGIYILFGMKFAVSK